MGEHVQLVRDVFTSWAVDDDAPAQGFVYDVTNDIGWLRVSGDGEQIDDTLHQLSWGDLRAIVVTSDGYLSGIAFLDASAYLPAPLLIGDGPDGISATTVHLLDLLVFDLCPADQVVGRIERRPFTAPVAGRTWRGVFVRETSGVLVRVAFHPASLVAADDIYSPPPQQPPGLFNAARWLWQKALRLTTRFRLRRL